MDEKEIKIIFDKYWNLFKRLEEYDKIKYHMSDEKIEQNIDRVCGYLRDFLFHTLGCSNGDAIKVLVGVIKRISEK